MKMPFTPEEFIEVFRNYNRAVFPIQDILYFFAWVAVFCAIKKSKWSSIIVMAILSFLWIWIGPCVSYFILQRD